MKASHLTTPRTMGECQFSPSMDPIEHYRSRSYGAAWWIAMAIVAVVTIILIFSTR